MSRSNIQDQALRVAVVTIGDELLVGDRLDTNARWLARRLTDTGFRVGLLASVGDNEDAIGELLADACDAHELVVTTGGLGPTHDDRTREAVAARWGLALEEDQGILRRLGTRYRARGLEHIPGPSRRLALVPTGAEVVSNPSGAAPGLLLEVPRRKGPGATALLLLPGIPSEVRALVEGPAGDRLRAVFEHRLDPPVARLVRTTGIAESALATRIEGLLADDRGVQVAYRPSLRGVEIRLSSDGRDALERVEAVESRIRAAVAGHEWDDPSGDLAGAAGRTLGEAGLTLAAAESCTGGLLLKRLTDVPGSSAWVRGGVVAYADDVKRRHLGVSEDVLATHGAVSGPVARLMARGVAERLGADVGVAITGIAGPGGAVPGKPVGTTWFAVSTRRGEHVERRVFPGDRQEVRERAAQHALHLVFREAASVAEVHANGGGVADANPEGGAG